MKKITAFITLLVVIILITFGLYYWHKHNNAPKMLEIPPIGVKTQAVTTHNIPLKVHAIGTIIAPQTVMLKAKVTGEITSLDFRSGDQVKKGQLLLTINDKAARAQFIEQKASLEKLNNQYQRFVQLEKEDAQAVSADDMEQKRGELKIARAKLANVRQQLKNTNVIAPFNGRIGNPQASQNTLYVGGEGLSQTTQLAVGAYLNDGDNIAILTNSERVEVQYQVPENYAQQLKLGQNVYVRSVAYPNQVFTGTVSYISPLVLPSSQAYNIRADIVTKAHPLNAGMSVAVIHTLEEQRAVLAVPGISLVPSLNGYAVYTIKDGKVEQTSVIIGQRYNKWVTLKSGLNAGDKIIVEGVGKVHAGSRVKVVN